MKPPLRIYGLLCEMKERRIFGDSLSLDDDAMGLAKSERERERKKSGGGEKLIQFSISAML
jgi:hypothetical protein